MQTPPPDIKPTTAAPPSGGEAATPSKSDPKTSADARPPQPTNPRPADAPPPAKQGGAGSESTKPPRTEGATPAKGASGTGEAAKSQPSDTAPSRADSAAQRPEPQAQRQVQELAAKMERLRNQLMLRMLLPPRPGDLKPPTGNPGGPPNLTNPLPSQQLFTAQGGTLATPSQPAPRAEGAPPAEAKPATGAPPSSGDRSTARKGEGPAQAPPSTPSDRKATDSEPKTPAPLRELAAKVANARDQLRSALLPKAPGDAKPPAPEPPRAEKAAAPPSENRPTTAKAEGVARNAPSSSEASQPTKGDGSRGDAARVEAARADAAKPEAPREGAARSERADTPPPRPDTGQPRTDPQTQRQLAELAAKVERMRDQLLLRLLAPPRAGDLKPPTGAPLGAPPTLAAPAQLLFIAHGGGFMNSVPWSIMPLMQTPPTSGNAPVSGATFTTSTAGAPELRDGQTVRATVLGVEGGRVSLRIGNQTLQMNAPVALQQGQQLELQVQQLRDLLVLRMIGAPRLADLVANGVRQALPQQGGLPPLLANLQALARGEAPMPTPRELNQLAGRFLQQLPQLQGMLSEQGVRQAIQESGLFLEAKLAQTVRAGGEPSGPLGQDMKTALLRLLTGLRSLEAAGAPREGSARAPGAPPPPTGDPSLTANRPPPPLPNAPLRAQPPVQSNLGAMGDFQELRSELMRQTQSALARVQLGQLSSVRTDPEANPQWMLEMPIRNGDAVDMVQVRIESRGAKRARKGGKSWTVSLALDLGKLGPMEAKVTLGEDESISTLFWSEREAATEALSRNMPLLQRNLTDCGLKVGRLGARTGEAPLGDEPALPVNLNLLDLKA